MVAQGGSTSHTQRVTERTPEWSGDDGEVRLLLAKIFPNKDTNPLQRKRAGEWMRMIQYYFRMHLTHSQITMKTNWSEDKVKSLIRNIKRAKNGERTDTHKPKHGKRGRPKKNTATLGAPYGSDGKASHLTL